MFAHDIHTQPHRNPCDAMPSHPFSKAAFGRSVLVAIPALVLISVGCSEPRIPVYAVTGKVTYKGQAPVGATVVLHSVDRSGTGDVAPSGTVKNNGTFAITSYEPGDGAPPGEYVATIEWYKFDPELGGAGPNVIPKKYVAANSSPIKVSVNGAPTEIPPIIIK